MFALIFSAICAWFAFFLPCFATYKALSQRPLPESDLERWCKYWTVIGGLIAVEYCAEWLVDWVPFYWQVKTVFLLFLSLPQTQGSTFIYDAYMRPFFAANEKDIDAGIVSMQGSVVAFFQSRIAAVSEILWSIVTKQPPPGQAQQPLAQENNQTQSGAPAGFNFQAAMGLWNAYGPAVVNAMKQGKGTPGTVATSAPPISTPVQATSAQSSSVSGYDTFADERIPVTTPQE